MIPEITASVSFEFSFLLHGLPAVWTYSDWRALCRYHKSLVPPNFSISTKETAALGRIRHRSDQKWINILQKAWPSTQLLTYVCLILSCTVFLNVFWSLKKTSKQMTNVCLCPQVCFWRSMRILILKDFHCRPSINGSKLGDSFHDFSSSFVTSALLIINSQKTVLIGGHLVELLSKTVDLSFHVCFFQVACFQPS